LKIEIVVPRRDWEEEFSGFIVSRLYNRGLRALLYKRTLSGRTEWLGRLADGKSEPDR
jgi:hypothetical protein